MLCTSPPPFPYLLQTTDNHPLNLGTKLLLLVSSPVLPFPFIIPHKTASFHLKFLSKSHKNWMSSNKSKVSSIIWSKTSTKGVIFSTIQLEVPTKTATLISTRHKQRVSSLSLSLSLSRSLSLSLALSLSLRMNNSKYNHLLLFY